MRTLTAAFVLAAALAAQDGEGAAPATPSADELIARCAKLPPDRRATVVRDLERRVQLENDDVVQRIASRQKGIAAYPPRARRATQTRHHR